MVVVLCIRIRIRIHHILYCYSGGGGAVHTYYKRRGARMVFHLIHVATAVATTPFIGIIRVSCFMRIHGHRRRPILLTSTSGCHA